ncbi:hypothetical protein CEUSTIGMA_g7581.t1 [Chlamydomonas eustigma]|uniref:Protein kinase domain-containing protein n=1 Tax=Chlamydomonas eustigma TaxID=1157962 RepID=A0A250XAJ8_9CHLO|nr:hypothetical protein CEUSTIGMA_g7581.t1 [Chlamydomonas eustigma]|eukprot:GAX80143.1 hypothetical protein CEUSTIGMA_g7581.t1 [Chlamydomonas eustigma]
MNCDCLLNQRCRCAEIARLQDELSDSKSKLSECISELSKLRKHEREATPIQSVPAKLPKDCMIRVATDFVQHTGKQPMQITLDQLRHISELNELAITAWSFTMLSPEESLQEHIKSQSMKGPLPVWPSQKGSLKFVSERCVKEFGLPSVEAAERLHMRVWQTANYRQEWQARVKNLLVGNYSSMVIRTVLFEDVADRGKKSGFLNNITWPALFIDEEGNRSWGLILQVVRMNQELEHAWGMRDLLSIKHTPACISIVSKDTGRLLWQNSASMAMFGCHGLFHAEPQFGIHPSSETIWGNQQGDTKPQLHQLQDQEHVGGKDFLELLFGCRQDAWFHALNATVKGGGYFRAQIEIKHPSLRALIDLKEGDEAHHDVQVSLSQDPVTLQSVFIISQVDITAAVVAQRQLQQAHSELAGEKIRTEALLSRQYDLIECIGWVSEVGRSVAGDARSAELIDRVWRQMIGERRMVTKSDFLATHEKTGEGGPATRHDVELMELMGEGSYGQVYRGRWKDLDVAVKCMVLPIKLSRAEHRDRMAIMEAAISSSLSHPNIVKTHTYSLKPVHERSKDSQHNSTSNLSLHRVLSGTSRSSEEGVLGTVTAFQVQIVQELCDRGSLRKALDRGVFHRVESDGQRKVLYANVLLAALDIARGMRHLHSCNILHSDLKALNVLLQSNTESTKGFTAKVADFGLSVKMLHSETHVSNLFQGTMTHMAPETMLTGQQSNAADVYAFGITLWELYTGQYPFTEVPHAMLGYQVSQQHIRPQFPPETPCELEVLAELCWQAGPASRPSFEEIEAVLIQLCEAIQQDELPMILSISGGPSGSDIEPQLSESSRSLPPIQNVSYSQLPGSAHHDRGVTGRPAMLQRTHLSKKGRMLTGVPRTRSLGMGSFRPSFSRLGPLKECDADEPPERSSLSQGCGMCSSWSEGALSLELQQDLHDS